MPISMHMLRKEKGGDPEKVLFAIGVAVLGAHPLTEMLCDVLLMVYELGTRVSTPTLQGPRSR